MIALLDTFGTVLLLGWWYWRRSLPPLVLLVASGLTSIPDAVVDLYDANVVGLLGALTWIGCGVWAWRQIPKWMRA